MLRQISRGLRALLLPSRRDAELDDEVRHYLEEATASGVKRGMSPHEARRAALVEMGNATVVREEVRSSGWEHRVETLLADLRYSFRLLRREPGFTIVCVLTLALGIGASTAIFSAIKPVLVDAMPYPDADRIVVVSDVSADGYPVDVTFGTYREVAVRARSFESIAALKPWQPTLVSADGGEPERLDGQAVSWSYFRALGVAPALGRAFEEREDFLGGPSVVILSDGVWRRRFGADRAIIGRDVTLDGRGYTVIGVMPAGFENVLLPSAQAWTPLDYDAALPRDGREWGHHLRMVGRLRADVSRNEAISELAGIARNRVSEFDRVSYAMLDNGLLVTPLQEDVARDVRPALFAVFGAVLLLLAIACVNVTNLLLARGAQRRGELAMRVALGAGTGRVTRQLLTESVTLALLGGAAGVVVAMVGVRALVALSPPGLPRVHAIHVDAGVVTAAVLLAVAVGVCVGLIPALYAGRYDLLPALHQGSRRTVGGHQRTRGALVVVEVALALVLLVSAGLLLRSLERLFSVAPGFDASRLLTMQVQAGGVSMTGDSAKRRFFNDAAEAVRHVPGVEHVALTGMLPLSGDIEKYGVTTESAPTISPEDDASAYRYSVTPDYFRVMRIPVLRGRAFDERDMREARVRPVIISQSLARRRFRGVDPIGQRIRFGGPVDRPWDVIVGVVGDVKQMSLASPTEDAVYVPEPTWLWAGNPMWFVVRARSGDAAALAPAVQRAIWSVDRGQPIVRVATMETVIASTAAQRRFAMILFEAFALAALVLASIGIYGVLAGRVAERTREIGVRAALGASPGDVAGFVVRQGVMLTLAGIVAGLAGAVVASKALITLLFGISRLDVVTYASVIGLLLVVAIIACLLPAWRAARLDPAITLRAE